MTQAELSEGIISVSYLSKIENGHTETTKEVIDLLCKRLNIKPITIVNDMFYKLVLSWIKHLLNNNIKEASKVYKEIISIEGNSDDHELLTLLEIHKLRYYILLNNKSKSLDQYKILQKKSNTFSGKEKYYWLKFAGDYHFFNISYQLALEFYKEAEKNISEDVFYKVEEENNLYYTIAVTGSKLKNTHITLLYSIKALEYYQDVYDLKKCAECHILLGISYQRIEEYSKAKESYNCAYTIGELLHDKEVLALCSQNLGKLYSMLKKPEKAIKHYIKSYELWGTHLEKKIISASNLMKEYYHKLNDFKNAKYWLFKGLSLSKDLNINDSIYVFEFYVYNYLINGADIESLEKLIIKDIFPFLDEKKLLFEKCKYLLILADYFFKIRKYKKSAMYYSEANQILNKNRSDFI